MTLWENTAGHRGGAENFPESKAGVPLQLRPPFATVSNREVTHGGRGCDPRHIVTPVKILPPGGDGQPTWGEQFMQAFGERG